jgi:CAAX protease family protein
MASISLALRRTGPASLGFHRVPRPGGMIITIFLLSVGWSLFQIGITKPILNI